MNEEGRRTFTFEEAKSLLPRIRQLTREAVEEMNAVAVPADADARTARQEAERAAAEILGRWARKVEALGIEVKGPWLIDFDSGAGYYCWRWPEESLQFFHGYEEGFAGRVSIQ